jgi:hypothetical protein
MKAEVGPLEVELTEAIRKLEGFAAMYSGSVETALQMCARRLRVALLLGARLDAATRAPSAR